MGPFFVQRLPLKLRGLVEAAPDISSVVFLQRHTHYCNAFTKTRGYKNAPLADHSLDSAFCYQNAT